MIWDKNFFSMVIYHKWWFVFCLHRIIIARWISENNPLSHFKMILRPNNLVLFAVFVFKDSALILALFESIRYHLFSQQRMSDNYSFPLIPIFSLLYIEWFFVFKSSKWSSFRSNYSNTFLFNIHMFLQRRDLFVLFM